LTLRPRVTIFLVWTTLPTFGSVRLISFLPRNHYIHTDALIDHNEFKSIGIVGDKDYYDGQVLIYDHDQKDVLV